VREAERVRLQDLERELAREFAEKTSALEALKKEFNEKLAPLQSEQQAAYEARVEELQSRVDALEESRRGLSESLAAVEEEAAALRAAVAERDRLREAERVRLQNLELELARQFAAKTAELESLKKEFNDQVARWKAE
jgi:uncharacterized protein YukE